MKILLVNHFPLTGSGSGIYTTNLAKSLIRKGHEIAIIFPENRSEYERYEGMKLYPVFFKNEEIIENVNQINMNFPCFTTHPRSNFSFAKMNEEERKIYEDAFYNKINSVIEEFKPDIVHAQHIWTLAGISAKCCEKHNLPLVVTCHGTDLMGIAKEKETKESWGTDWARVATKYAKRIITISKDSNQLAETLLPEAKEKTIWIRNGVDNNLFFRDKNINKMGVLKDLGVHKDYKKIVSFVGKFADFKGIDVLLDAAAIYEDEDTLTIIVGDGELKSKLKEQAHRLHLKNVAFVGAKPHEKLKDIYNIANCSLVPSRREPFGLVAAEALLCGTPVIATNQGGLPDFVTPDVGILVDVEDSKGLAEAVIKILKGKVSFDKEYIEEKIKKSYSQDAIISEFENIYKKATQKE